MASDSYNNSSLQNGGKFRRVRRHDGANFSEDDYYDTPEGYRNEYDQELEDKGYCMSRDHEPEEDGCLAPPAKGTQLSKVPTSVPFTNQAEEYIWEHVRDHGTNGEQIQRSRNRAIGLPSSPWKNLHSPVIKLHRPDSQFTKNVG